MSANSSSNQPLVPRDAKTRSSTRNERVRTSRSIPPLGLGSPSSRWTAKMPSASRSPSTTGIGISMSSAAGAEFSTLDGERGQFGRAVVARRFKGIKIGSTELYPTNDHRQHLAVVADRGSFPRHSCLGTLWGAWYAWLSAHFPQPAVANFSFVQSRGVDAPFARQLHDVAFVGKRQFLPRPIVDVRIAGVR